MGPDDVKAPESQAETIGTKKVSDLVENLKFTKSGDTIKASGTLKTISEAWTDFDPTGNNTGHFLPILLPEKCKSKQVTCKNREAGNREVTIDDDLMLITRLENLKTPLIELEMDGKPLMKIDLTTMLPTGKDVYNAEKKDFGRFGTVEALTENLSITWTGIKGKATGKLKYLSGEARTKFEQLKADGCYLPIGLSEWYGEGVPKMAGIKNIQKQTAQDIVFRVEDNTMPVKVSYLGQLVMEIDLSGLTVETQASEAA